MFSGCLFNSIFRVKIVAYLAEPLWFFQGWLFMVSSTFKLGSLVWTTIRPTRRNMHKQRKQLVSRGTIALL